MPWWRIPVRKLDNAPERDQDAAAPALPEDKALVIAEQERDGDAFMSQVLDAMRQDTDAAFADAVDQLLADLESTLEEVTQLAREPHRPHFGRLASPPAGVDPAPDAD